jgi:methionine synthase I (cobalamin-dependent)
MATMKSWHVIVLDGWKTIEEKNTFSVTESREEFTKLKEKYDEINKQAESTAKESGTKPTVYSVKREYY